MKEQIRRDRIGNWFHSVIFDYRYSRRQLRKNLGFAVFTGGNLSVDDCFDRSFVVSTGIQKLER